MPEPSSARLRIAVAGAGMGSAPHFKSLEGLRDVIEVPWVCTRNAARLAAGDVPGDAQRTTRLEDILEDRSTDAVLVLTPPNTHLEIATKAVQAGKHVLLIFRSCPSSRTTPASLRASCAPRWAYCPHPGGYGQCA